MEMEVDSVVEDDLERAELIRSCLQLASELEQLDGELREKREKNLLLKQQNKQLEEELAESGERPERDGHQQEMVGISDCRVDDALNGDDLNREEEMRRYLQLKSELKKLEDKLFGKPAAKNLKLFEDDVLEVESEPEEQPEVGQQNDGQDNQSQDNFFQGDEINLEDAQENGSEETLQKDERENQSKNNDCRMDELSLEDAEENESEDALQRNELENQAEDIDYWLCQHPGCGRRFNNKDGLRKHRYIHTTKYQCQECQKCFENSSRLQDHLPIHTGKRPFVVKNFYKTMYKCQHPGCGRRYKSKTNLRRHKNIHTTKYQCQECQKCFEKSSVLQNHLRTHTGERPFACDWVGCGQRFKIKSTLIVHIKQIHSKDRPFHCHYKGCVKVFKLKSTLQDHLQSHSTSRSFKCRFPGCSKTFKTSPSLYSHMKYFHSNSKQFRCDVANCQKAFKSKSGLTYHKKSHL